MSQATIELVDHLGEIRVSVNFKDGFDKDSNAHQVANLMLKSMDGLMERKEDITDVADKLGLSVS